MSAPARRNRTPSAQVERDLLAAADALLIKGFDRMRATLEAGDEPDMLERLRSCCLRYRAFALGSKHFYAIMFEEAITRGHDSAEVGEHARAAFGALVRNVEDAARWILQSGYWLA